MYLNLSLISILIPSLVSLSLILFGLISDRWVTFSFRSKGRYVDESNLPSGLVKSYERIPFIKRYNMFKNCIHYRWINVVHLNSSVQNRQCSTGNCKSDEIMCGRCCVNATLRCDNLPECESYDDEIGCPRLLGDIQWLDRKLHCFRRRFKLTSVGRNSREAERTTYLFSDNLLQLIMAWLLISAAILTAIVCIVSALLKFCPQHLSIPFSFITIASFFSFLSGAGSLGIFLFQWIHHRIALTQFEAYKSNAVIYRLNPWLLEIEQFDIAFYICAAGVLLTLVTSFLCLCYCCGATAGNRFSRRGTKGKYEIVKVLPYEDHFVKS
ncbi:hypothetical protein ACOME3_010225 [Neoechinorhynchus agilis]